MIVHFLLAVVEFFLINWLGDHIGSFRYYQISFIQNIEDAPLFNIAFRVLAPTVYLVLAAASAYALGFDTIVPNLWRVTVFYVAIRWAFNVALGRAMLLRWPNQILVALFACTLSLLVSRQLLTDKNVVLPTARGLMDQLWIAVIGFIYITLNRVKWPAVTTDRERRRRYVTARLSQFEHRYGGIIQRDAESREVENLCYAIMIYEGFNRPPLYQFLERHFLYPFGLASSLGPMQVQVQVAVSNEELVQLAVKKIRAEFRGAVQQVSVELAANKAATSAALSNEVPAFASLNWAMRRRVLELTAKAYNIRSDYPQQVLEIYDLVSSTRERSEPMRRGNGT